MNQSAYILWLEKNTAAFSYEKVSAAQVRLPVTFSTFDAISWDPEPTFVVLRGARAEILAALHKLRSLGGSARTVPVLMISSDCLDDDLAAQPPGAAVDILPEPFSAAALTRKINLFLGFFERGEAICTVEKKGPLSAGPDLSESRFLDSLFENLPIMVFVKDAANLKFVRFNRAGEELLGASRAELIGKSDFDFFPEEQARAFVEKDRAVLSGHSIVEISEELIQTRHGGERVLHTKKIPIFGASGKPEYLLGISEDITELKRADQERLRLIREQARLEEREESNRRTMLLAESSMLLAASFDYRKSLTMLAELVTPAFADVCSILLTRANEMPETIATRGSWLSLSAEILAHLKSRSLEEAECGRSLLKPEAEVEGIRSFLSVPIQIRGQLCGLMQFGTREGGHLFTREDLVMAEELARRAGVAMDNAMLYETAQKAIQVRDEFLSIASHELKTPMTSLKLQIQMTRRTVDPKENRVPSAERLAKVLDISAVQVNRLNALVDDLLDVSRIQSGKLTYQFESVELGSLVREMVDRYFENLQSAGCRVEVKAEDLVWVRADRYRLEQVVLNLLSNAAKYGRARPVEVSVSADNGEAHIFMRDHGIGIPSDKLDKVFERFERAIASTHISGLGLGLYISREIMKAHEGTIRVDSILGEGSVFSVSLPLLESSFAPPPDPNVFGEKNSQSYLP